MSNHAARYLLAALLLAVAPANASLIDVTTQPQVTLATNDSLIFTLAADYSTCRNSNYPGAIEILLGSMPLGGTVESIPGTSGVYMPGILFTASLQSANGAISIPLTDPNAARMGLPTGDILLTPGSRSGGSYSGPIDLISASVTISSQEAAELFASGEVVVDIHDIGGPITFGYPGSAIASDFSASLISQDGSQSAGARVLEAQCAHSNTPEPGTVGLLIIGLTTIAARVRRAKRS
jgi:hypothetical protein